MPDPAGTFTDGTLVFGSQALTIKNSAGVDQVYIADDFSLSSKSKWLESNNISGVPAKQAGMKQIRTGSATLQLADSTTLAPKQFAVFPALEAGGATVNLIVADVDYDIGTDKETKFKITLREKLT